VVDLAEDLLIMVQEDLVTPLALHQVKEIMGEVQVQLDQIMVLVEEVELEVLVTLEQIQLVVMVVMEQHHQ
jgi:hypothetical protein